MLWKKVTLVGVGLLGGSLGLALRERRLAGCVAGYVRRPASIRECRRAGAVDFATLGLGEAITGADLVVLCTPIGQMRALTQQMLKYLAPNAIVTDVGSVKASVVRELERLLAKAGAQFVGSHPMAGSEKTGVSVARGDLFEGAACVVTVTPGSRPVAVRKVEDTWRRLGAKLVRTTPKQHDFLVSRSSHLPHVAAVTLVNLVLGARKPPEQALLCANGFRDTTRIASGSPEMWRDIALANRRELSRALGDYGKLLGRFAKALERGDQRELAKFFERGKQLRDALAASGGSHSPE